MSKGVVVEDYMRLPHTIYNTEDLYNIYELWEAQRNNRSKEKLAAMGQTVPDMAPDDFADWLVKRGICPHAIITPNSRYHFENIALCDSDMGLKMPDPTVSIADTPAIFFEALGIVRSARAKVKEEENAQNNRNQNPG